MRILELIKRKIDLRNLDNLAVAILCGVVLLLSAIVIYSEAFTPERSGGVMDIFGWKLELDYKRKDFNNVLGITAAFGAVFCIATMFFKRAGERLKKVLFAVLLTLVVVSTAAATLKYGFIRYYYFDFGDAFSYFLGPKYFKELGYDVHYECAAAAQMENGTRLAEWGRDLRTNKIQRPIQKLATPEARRACRNRFSESRWASYKEDVATFRGWHGREGWKRRFRDHGYNGTPVYQAIAGVVANAVELNHRNMVILALLNLWMVLVMFGGVIKAFGWRFGLLFCLLFFTNFMERWLLGGAYLRYEWVTAVVIGVSCLKLERYAAAGALFAFAAGVKIFPVLLFAGIGAAVIWDLVERRGIKPEYRRFIAGAAITGVALGVISVIHGHGVQNWSEFLHQMGLNSGRFSTMRIGFVYNFLWPKEVLPSDGVFSYDMRVSAMKAPFLLFLSLDHLRWILTGGVLYFVFKNLRQMDDITRTTFVGFVLFFMFFGTVRYYYSAFLGMPLMLHGTFDRHSGKLFMAYLFIISVAGYIVQDVTAFPFPYTTLYPMALTIFIVAYLIYVEVDRRRRPA